VDFTVRIKGEFVSDFDVIFMDNFLIQKKIALKKTPANAMNAVQVFINSLIIRHSPFPLHQPSKLHNLFFESSNLIFQRVTALTHLIV
jgi:hypothetical protein